MMTLDHIYGQDAHEISIERRRPTVGKMWKLRRIEDKISSLILMFALGSSVFWLGAFNATGQSLQVLQDRLMQTRERQAENTADIANLRADMRRQSESMESMTKTINELAKAINQLAGIGIAITGLGAVIFIFQSVQLVQRRKPSGGSG